MSLKSLALNFLVGGTVTALIVGLEESELRTWSGIAALMPVFTMVSYFFIGQSGSAIAVSQHSKFVLVGTLVSWMPYMAVVALTAPRLGVNRSIGLGLAVFFVLATAYVSVTAKYRLFR